MKNLPRGIVRTPNGNFVARVFRKGVMHRSTTVETLAEAVDALNELHRQLGPRGKRGKTVDVDWTKERQRQVRALGNPRMTGIYNTPSGFKVHLVRSTGNFYGGHFQDLQMALDSRDNLEKLI